MLVGSSACGLLSVLKVASHLPAADTSTDVSELLLFTDYSKQLAGPLRGGSLAS